MLLWYQGHATERPAHIDMELRFLMGWPENRAIEADCNSIQAARKMWLHAAPTNTYACTK